MIFLFQDWLPLILPIATLDLRLDVVSIGKLTVKVAKTFKRMVITGIFIAAVAAFQELVVCGCLHATSVRDGILTFPERLAAARRAGERAGAIF